MSSPKGKQCRQILERVSTLLDEYDDVRYALVVRDNKNHWHSMTRLIRRDEVVMARYFLDDALRPRKKKKRGRT